jgi:ovo-like protein
MNAVFSPLSMGSSMASPGSPNSTSPGRAGSGGGKMKSSPSRKKSTSSNSGMTPDEEDISNIPSLQTRIQIISQRLGIPPDAPIELINGGHGIKNPLSHDPTEVKPEKLPPARPESDPTKFQCRLCSKIFTLQRLLNRHMKCHSDTKRYLCTFCGKGFNDTFDLKRHTRTHTGVRPYKCNLCEKSFTQRCSLESHCLKVHGVAHQYDYKQRRSKMYVCEDCGHTTPEPEVHYLHLKDNHPFSPALHKFYDKRHFKFTNANFANMLLQVNS